MGLAISSTSKIVCDDVKIGKKVEIGDDVIIKCKKLRLGNNVKIGVKTEENFKYVAGVRIETEELIFGDDSMIDRGVLIKGGVIKFGNSVKIKANNSINVKKILTMDNYCTINENCEITGVDIKIGKELWMLPYVKIGGGSSFEVHSKLRIGDFCHIGMYSFINTARPVYIGNEVGLGTRTCLYTHGAYSSILKGFPVKFGKIHIGDNSWLPGAIVNPGVKIGKDCVIGVGSVVTKDIPDGCLAAGVPVKVIKGNSFPKRLTKEEIYKIMFDFMKTFAEILADEYSVNFVEKDNIINLIINNNTLIQYSYILKKDSLNKLERAIFLFLDHKPNQIIFPLNTVTLMDLRSKKTFGRADTLSERLLNQLRRYGVRFRFENREGFYSEWKA